MTAAVTVALRLLAVLDQPLPLPGVGALAVGLGLLNGGLNGAELGKAHSKLLVAVGTACAVFVAVALLAGQVATVRATWARVAVRAAASWVAASGLLMLGWSLRGS